jgi:hypothetical protein
MPAERSILRAEGLAKQTVPVTVGGEEGER